MSSKPELFRAGLRVGPHWIRRMVAAAALMVAGVTSVGASVELGDPFPELRPFALEGTVPDLQGRVVVIDFWASWCAPCKASFPALAGLQREFADKGLVIVGVSVDEKAGPYETFVKRLAPPFATVRDASQELARRVRIPAMPTSYVVDRRGRVRFVHVGFRGEATVRELRWQVTQLLEEKP